MNPSTIDKLARQERIRREILNKSDLIPSLPDVALKVIDLLNQGDTEPEELERHLRYDQVLVAKLLSIVNSPFYAVNRKITTVAEAVMVLGFRGVRSLVLASSTAQLMSRDFSLYGYTDKGLWVHALTTATAARTLAKELRLGAASSEEMFVAGLLHDIGKMLVMPYLLETGVKSIPKNECECSFETNAIGIDHTEAGALVCAKWNLSQLLQSTVKHHHYPPGENENVDPSDAKLYAIVRVANKYANELGHGLIPEQRRTVEQDPSDFALLGMDDESWTEARERIDFDVDAAIASLADLCS